jgi:acrylyl-CoA reductase (NADPH)
MSNFRALVLTEKDGKVSQAFETLGDDQLPPGEVTVNVSHTTINYKDGLVLGGLGRIVRKYPHIPGIDFAGTVETSSSPAYKPGDKVVLTGWGVGENHFGGFSQKARVKADWLVPLPDGLSTKQAMAIGTAGFTAMLCIVELEAHGITPADGEVLVTGAAGGVGGVAVAVLAKLGYTVAASTGRADAHDYLKSLGAKVIVDRTELAAPPAKPLLGARWSGAVDTVGGATLANVIAQLKYAGAVAACGNAGGVDLPTNVLPFILRGVRLLGVDSVSCPKERRVAAWKRLARDLPLEKLDALTSSITLDEVPEAGAKILKGQVRGRVVVEVK